MEAPPSLILRGGYGAAKTWSGILWILDRALKNGVDVKSLVVEPTFKQIKKVLLPKFKEVLGLLGIMYTLNKSDLTITLDCGRQIWLESGQNPETLSGFDVGPAWIDEPELMQPEIDDRVGSRVRDPHAVCRQLLYTGTPEGMTWLDDKVPTTPTITVATTDNTHLTQDFIKRQLDKYKNDPVRMDMYFRGIPRTLAGSIYTCLIPDKHFKPCKNPRGSGELVICCDFNVGLMAWPIARCIGDEIHIFSEVVNANVRTTEQTRLMIAHLTKMNLVRFRGGEIVGPNGQRVDAWCDATSTAEKTSSTTTDHNILRDAGFWPVHARSNPAVKDRIEAVQYALSHDLLFVDPIGAPFTARALQRHEYDRNSRPPRPRKKWSDSEQPLDAATDPVGYLTYGRSPLRNHARAA